MDIVLTGSVAYDYLMVFPGNFKDHILPDKLESISLSFLVESMVRLRGGTAPNIAYTLALLGQRPRLFATVGEDFEDYRRWLEMSGVDTHWAKVVPGVYTASYFANTDRTNAQIASFYPGAMAYAAQLSLEQLEQHPDLVVISPNDPQAMKQYVVEAKRMGMRYLYDPSQQIVRLTGDELRQGIDGAVALFVNDYEFALVQKTTGMSARDILGCTQFLVVTRGEKGASVFGGDGEIHIPVVPPTAIADPTGVGDAFRGGFLTAYGYGLDLETCGRVGALAATYCLEQSGPQGHHYSREQFVHRYGEVFGSHAAVETIAAR